MPASGLYEILLVDFDETISYFPASSILKSKNLMKNSAKIALVSLIAAGLAAPVLLRADDTATNAMSSAASQTTPATPHKHKVRGLPFHGTLGEVDTNAMTLTVGSRTFQITSKTKITKDGQPAILAEGIVGQPVSGYYRTNDSGSLDAVTVHFGAHGRHKHQGSDSSTSTNSASSH